VGLDVGVALISSSFCSICYLFCFTSTHVLCCLCNLLMVPVYDIDRHTRGTDMPNNMQHDGSWKYSTRLRQSYPVATSLSLNDPQGIAFRCHARPPTAGMVPPTRKVREGANERKSRFVGFSI